MAVKTKDLPAASNMTPNDSFLVTSESGTARVPFGVLVPEDAGAHNAIYRGKCLGNGMTAAQSEAIRAGTFNNLYVGDYWTVDGVNFRIAAFDYWYLTGDVSCETHHAVIVPDTHLYTAAMNPTDTTEGGYVGSEMYKTGLEQAKTIFANAFGSDHILKHRTHLVNAVSNGRASGGAWYDSTVELMNENMAYGSNIFAPASDGSNIPGKWTECRGQLPLFMLQPRFIHTRSYWCWLRDVVSAACFAYCHADGNATSGGASDVGGVRPAVPVY